MTSNRRNNYNQKPVNKSNIRYVQWRGIVEINAVLFLSEKFSFIW
jgi:succinate dehydrogenase flavin-adding protein (antitoxin of CptAB toxin-antitoxin module)